MTTGTEPSTAPGSKAARGYTSDINRYPVRLKRTEDQASAIHAMIDEETYCIGALTQINLLKSDFERCPRFLGRPPQETTWSVRP